MSITETRMTKAELRAAARAESARIQAEQAAREARQKRLLWGGLGALLAVLIGVVLAVTQPWRGDANAVPNFDVVPMDQVVNTPANTTPEGGFALTAAGGTTAYINPDIPTLDIYFDYMCPFCRAFEDVNLENLMSMVADNEANVVMHPVSILDRFTPRTRFSTRALAAAGWIANYAPDSFLAFHEAMFQNQPSEAGGDMSSARMAELARAAGVPANVAAGIEDGTATQTFGQWVVSLTARNVNDPALRGPDGGFGTPTIALDGVYWLGPDGRPGDWTNPDNLTALVAAARNS